MPHKRQRPAKSARVHIFLPAEELAVMNQMAAVFPYNGNRSLLVRDMLRERTKNAGAKVLTWPRTEGR